MYAQDFYLPKVNSISSDYLSRLRSSIFNSTLGITKASIASALA